MEIWKANAEKVVLQREAQGNIIGVWSRTLFQIATECVKAADQVIPTLGDVVNLIEEFKIKYKF